jgi:hypothetical protein
MKGNGRLPTQGVTLHGHLNQSHNVNLLRQVWNAEAKVGM